jgi:DNA-binding response OmpR family regulator
MTSPRILVVDNDARASVELPGLLRNEGYAVETESDGNLGLQREER